MSQQAAAPQFLLPDQLWECHRARLTRRYVKPSVVVLSAGGELDASNADHVVRYAMTQTANCRTLIVDLGAVTFCGTAGFSALHKINVGCARIGVHWMVVPGRAVRRLLRIADPQAVLPLANTVDAALAIADRNPAEPTLAQSRLLSTSET